MLFRHLQFHNFLSFRGTNTLEFPDSNCHPHSLMLVLGPNSAGKSNVVRALRFLFCGDPLGHPKDPHKLINDAAAADSKADETVEGWVEAKILYRERERTIRRRVKARCLRQGALILGETVLEEQRHERKGDAFVMDQGETQKELELMVPPSLFDYFFFEGESLAQQLIGGKDAKGIREGLATLIHEHEWEATAEAVREVRNIFARDLKHVADASKDYQDIVKNVQDVQKELDRMQKVRLAHEAKFASAKAEYEKCESQIVETSRGKSYEALNDKLETARSALKKRAHQLGSLETELAQLVGTSHGLPLLQPSFEPALRLLNEMREQNLLPADVSEGFVTRLLNWSKNKTCICGRSLDPKAHKAERDCIEEYRKRTMAVDLNTALLDLLNSLEEDNKRGFQSRAEGSAKLLREKLETRDALILDVADLGKRVSSFEDDRSRLNVEAIQLLQAQQRKAANNQLIARENLTKEERDIFQFTQRLNELQTELRAKARSSGADQIMQLSEMCGRAAELADFIDEARTAVKDAFHSRLKAFVSNYYDPIAPDNSKAWVDPETLLPAIRVNGEVRRNLGGAQQQLLVLSHIVSLAQLRTWLHQELEHVGLRPGKIDDHCFVLDSVFGQLADQFREQCAQFLVKKAPQIVVLVASQQWDEVVRTRLENEASKAYRFIKHTDNPDITPEERTMLFRGKSHTVFKQLPKGSLAYTTIEAL